MGSSNVCWGIEAGAGAIKALKLSRSGDRAEVLDFVVIPHKRVLSSPELDQVEAMRQGLSVLTSQYDLSGAGIAISVPGHSAFARFAKLPPVEPKKVKDIVKFEAVQQIPFPIEEVEWDYQTFATPDSPDVEVGIFAMTREKVMERLALWAEFDITPDVINLSPVAAYNAMAYDLDFGDKTPGTVILDVGTTSTDLIVSEPGRMWIRTFPIGGHQFTEALVEAFKLGYPKAEKLKLEAEASKHARHVFQAMRPVFGDLAQDVQRSIGYYQSLHREANLTRLIGLGSTFNLPGLRKYLSQQLQMEVIRPEHFNKVKVEGARAEEFQASALNLATAYGLALQGIGLHACHANLMPVKVIRDAMWKRKVKWFALAAGLSVAGAGVAFIKPMIDKARIESTTKPASVDQVKQQLRTLKGDWTKVAGAYKEDPRAAASLVLIDRRDIYPWLVDDLGQMLSTAQSKAKDKGLKGAAANGLIFKQYTTQFFGADGSTSGIDSGAERPRPRGRGGRSGRGRAAEGEDPAAAPPPPPASPDGTTPTAAVPAGAKSEVRVTLTVSMVASGKPEAEEFLRDTIKTWLLNNSDRASVPYVIAKDSIVTQQMGEPEVMKGDVKPDQPAGDTEPVIPIDDPQDREDGIDPALQPRNGGGRGFAGGDGSRGGQSPPSGGGGQGSTAIKDLAPLPGIPPLAEPGAKVWTYQVKFNAQLKEPKKPEGQA